MFEKQCYKGAFGNIELELGVAQTAGVMEVVHGVTGLVR